MEFHHFGDEAGSRTAFDVNNGVERVRDVRLDGPKAKVRPETTMATSESPRAMVLVKACCSTFTALSHGEFACAKAGTARARPNAAIANPYATNRRRRTMPERCFMGALLL
jgi:hypothetical protein